MSTPINDGGPAFPVVASTGDSRDGVYCRDGISMRDYFAAQALNGFLSQDGGTAFRECEVAGFCYNYADAMIRAREEGSQ